VTDADRQATAGDGLLPAIDFSTFVMSLSHSVLVNLGDAPDPEGKRGVHLELARQTIDLLALLQEKTKGNLTGPEEQLLEQALTDLRLRYVEVARAKTP
jgi:hypothetical protein